jgi:hypothetical protein
MFGVRGAKTKAGLDAHEDGNANNKTDQKIGSNSLGITSTSIEVISDQIESLLIIGLAVENVDGHTYHNIDNTRNPRGQILILSLPLVAICHDITVQLLHKSVAGTIPLLWVVNISLSEPFDDNQKVHVPKEG